MDLSKAANPYIGLIERQSVINGRYENVTRIDSNAGDGYFSLVFKADDRQTRRKVALKFYDPTRRDDYRERCFDRESAILESLKGQRDILQLVEPRYDLTLQITDGKGISFPVLFRFFVTDLATSNAREYIYGDSGAPDKNLLYFRAMCRAVQRIHTSQICHRDLKPENFFIVRAGEICLGDFGTARILNGSEPPMLSQYASWRGDRRYTAPEMFAGLDEDTSLFYRADIFSLGAILFEMFTKQNLNTLIFDAAFQIDLLKAFQLIPEARRPQMFSDLVGEIALQRRLPDINAFGNFIPRSVVQPLDRLYKGLANLDYRRRTNKFQDIFTGINRCVTILRDEKKYEKLLELRQRWQQKRREKMERAKTV